MSGTFLRRAFWGIRGSTYKTVVFPGSAVPAQRSVPAPQLESATLLKQWRDATIIDEGCFALFKPGEPVCLRAMHLVYCWFFGLEIRVPEDPSRVILLFVHFGGRNLCRMQGLEGKELDQAIRDQLQQAGFTPGAFKARVVFIARGPNARTAEGSDQGLRSEHMRLLVSDWLSGIVGPDEAQRLVEEMDSLPKETLSDQQFKALCDAVYTKAVSAGADQAALIEVDVHGRVAGFAFPMPKQ